MFISDSCSSPNLLPHPEPCSPCSRSTALGHHLDIIAERNSLILNGIHQESLSSPHPNDSHGIQSKDRYPVPTSSDILRGRQRPKFFSWKPVKAVAFRQDISDNHNQGHMWLSRQMSQTVPASMIARLCTYFEGGAALHTNCRQLNCLDSRDAGIIVALATFTPSQVYAALEKSPRQVAVADIRTWPFSGSG